MTDVLPDLPEKSPLATALDELAGLLLATHSFTELMSQLADLAVRTVPPALTCGITLSQAGRVVTVGSSSTLAGLLDEQQYGRGEGPCLEAVETSKIVDAPDLSRDRRWHGYGQLAMAHGVSSVYASPIVVEGTSLGALNLYAGTPYAFDAPASRVAVAHAVTMTRVAVTATLRQHTDVTLSDQLQAALNSRSVIDQAVGIVMATQRCSATTAFTLLRGISQTRNIRLAVIARDLVERTAATPGPD